MDVPHSEEASNATSVGDSQVSACTKRTDPTTSVHVDLTKAENLIQIHCSNCHQSVSVPEWMIEDFVQCPSCGKTIKVTTPPKNSETSKTSTHLPEKAPAELALEVAKPPNDSSGIKIVACELCNSTDLIKQNGIFVCQSCGAKYSLEAMREMRNAEESTHSGNSSNKSDHEPTPVTISNSSDSEDTPKSNSNNSEEDSWIITCLSVIFFLLIVCGTILGLFYLFRWIWHITWIKSFLSYSSLIILGCIGMWIEKKE